MHFKNLFKQEAKVPGCINPVMFLLHRSPVIAEVDPQYPSALKTAKPVDLEFFVDMLTDI